MIDKKGHKSNMQHRLVFSGVQTIREMSDDDDENDDDDDDASNDGNDDDDDDNNNDDSNLTKLWI